MAAHTYSLNPARHPDETPEEYKERRAGLSKMADKAGKWGYVKYAPGDHVDKRTGKPKPYIRNDKDA